MRHRHHSTPALDRVVVLAPRPEWVARLPGGKLPDRSDFQRFGDDLPARQAAWGQALSESARLAQEFADWTDGRLAIDIEPL